MILAIVGSSQLTPVQTQTTQWMIACVLDSLVPEQVVSGGAKGVDTLAEMEAHLVGAFFQAILPQHQSWEGGNGLPGYKARNIQIADICDQLVCIRSKTAETYGSGWTADYAEGLGKPVRRLYV